MKYVLIMILFFSSFAYAISNQSLISSKDTYLREDTPDTNFGTSEKAYIGLTGTEDELRVLYFFNVSLPYGADIINATLRLFVVSADDSTLNIEIHKLLVDWNETTSTWNTNGTIPWIGGNFSSKIEASKTLNVTGFYEFNITSLVQYWVDNENKGFIIVPSNDTIAGVYKYFATRETLNASRLPTLIFYWDANDAPNITNFNDTSTIENPTNVGNYVTFNAYWSDPDSSTVQLFVCNSSNITYQGCHDTTYCTSTFTNENPVSCSYQVKEDEYEETYYAMICDDERNCSSIVQGMFYVNHAPQVFITRPYANEEVNETYAIQFNVSDVDNNTLYASLWYSSIKGAKQNLIISHINLTEYCDNPDDNWTTWNNCTYFWNTSDIGGYFYLDIEVNDTHITTLNSSEKFRVTSVIDEDPPNMTNWSITQDLTAGEITTIRINVTDMSLEKVWVVVDGPNFYQKYEMIYEGNDYFNTTFYIGNKGDYTYQIFANDSFGNQNQTPLINFIVSEPNCYVNLSVPKKALPSSVVKIETSVFGDPLNNATAMLNVTDFHFMIDYPKNQTLEYVQNTTLLWFVSVPDNDGTYLINVVWKDKFGNSFVSDVHTLEVTSLLGAEELKAEIVGGTEYKSGEKGEIIIFLTNATGSYVTNATCFVKIYNTTKELEESNYTDELGNGIYYYTFLAKEEGIHIAWVDCYKNNTHAYAAHSYHVAPWATQIETIYNATIAKGGYIIDFGSDVLEVGTPANIWIKVYNENNASATFRIKVVIKYSNTIKYSVTDIVTLPSGNSTFNMSETFTPDVAGTHSIELTLMSADASKIYDTHATTFEVPGQLIYDVGVDCFQNEVYAGNNITANITIWNLGDYYQDVQLTWWLENDEIGPEGSLPIAIYPKQKRSVIKTLVVPSSWKPGKYYFKARVSFGNNETIGYCSFYVISEEVITEPSGPRKIEKPTTIPKPEIDIIVNNIVASAGRKTNTTLVINNIGSVDIRNIRVIIPQIPRYWYEINPELVEVLKPGGSQIFTIVFFVPLKEKSIVKDITIRIESYDIIKEKTITFRIISYVEMLWNKLDKLENQINNLYYTTKKAEEQGKDVREVKSLLKITKDNLQEAKNYLLKGEIKETEDEIILVENLLKEIQNKLKVIGIPVLEKPKIDWEFVILTSVISILVITLFIILLMLYKKIKHIQHLAEVGAYDEMTEFEKRLEKLRRRLMR